MNTARTTLTSFLAYFVMSAVISPIGVISGPIAEHYNISVTAATASFTALTVGMLVGSLMAMFVYDFLRLKTIMVACFALVVAASAALYLVDTLALLPLWLFIIGLVCGINLASAIVVITENFRANLRASMMLLTDSFYSAAGAASTAIAGYFLLRSCHWSSAFSLAVGASLLAVLVAAWSRYPSVDRKTKSLAVPGGAATEPWPLSVYLVGLAIVAYLVGFGTVYAWIPNYAQTALSAEAAASGELVSRLFLGMFAGQLVMFFLVLRVEPVLVLIVAAAAATVITVMLWHAPDVAQLSTLMLSLGLATGGLFKLLVSFGTTVVTTPTPRMISMMIFCASVGTALSPAISSAIVELADIRSALVFTSGCYLLTVAVILIAFFARRRHRRLAAAFAE